MSRILAIGVTLAALPFLASPALSDSCPPHQQQAQRVTQAQTAQYSTRSTTHSYRVARHAVRTHRHFAMEEPSYRVYDEGYVSEPYWRVRQGWWEWHPEYPESGPYGYDYRW